MDVLLAHGRQAGDLGDARAELAARGVTEAQAAVRVQVVAAGRVARAPRGRQPRRVTQQLDQRLLPVLPVAQQTQIAQGFLGGTELALPLAEFVAEGYEQSAQTLALVLRQGHDASEVVTLGGLFFFGKVTHEVAAVLVPRHHAVEEERVHVVVERLVVQKQLRQQTQISTPGALSTSVDLEKGNKVVAVDLVAGRVAEFALGPVPLKGLARREIRQTKLVNVDHVDVSKLLGVRTEIPRLDDVLAHLDLVEVAHEVELGVVLDHRPSRAQFLNLLLGLQDRGHLLLRLGGHVRHFDVGASRGELRAVFVTQTGQRSAGLGQSRVVRDQGILAVLLPARLGWERAFAVIASFGRQ